MKIWTWIVTPEAASDRADRALLLALERDGLGVSRSQLHRLFDEDRVTLDGKSIKPNSKLAAGRSARIEFPAPKPMEITPEERPLEILYEDEHLVVVNKPPGLTVHPSTTQMEGTLVHALLFHIKNLSGIGGVLRPGIVHRLDKDTSGAMVVTKTDAAHQQLTEIFSKHEIERRYWALCYGSLEIPPGQKELRVETLIGRNPNDRKKMSANVKDGRRAVTHFRRIEEYGLHHAKPFACQVEARLDTGRTHQVRVHLTGLGHSILGDPVYGVPTSRHPKWLALPEEVRARVEALPGQALHARVLGFRHPVTGQELRFEAEPPEEFRLLLDSLGKYR